MLAAMGIDFVTALGGAASSLGNIGPAFGFLGPVENYDVLPAVGKWWCAFLMFIGRLELFTVLILLPRFSGETAKLRLSILEVVLPGLFSLRLASTFKIQLSFMSGEIHYFGFHLSGIALAVEQFLFQKFFSTGL